MSTGDILKELAAMRAHFELRFDQMKIETKVEASQLKAEIGQLKTEMNRRMDDLTGRVVELGQQMQQNPIDGGDGGQVNQEQVDEAINNAGDEAQNGQENEDNQQDAVSVKSEIDSISCQSEFDRWLNGEEEDIAMKEEVDGDSGTGGQQQSEDQALFQPVAGPSGISSGGQKRPQVNPPRRSNRLAANNKHPLNLAESSDTDEDETDSPSSPPPTKKARTTTTSKGNKARRCPECSKMFANLSQHLRTHTDERPHLCDLCPKAFAQKANLTVHRRIHTGERPFVCQQVNCGRAFAHKSDLDDHLRRHLGEKRHHCGECGKHFYSSSELAKHHRQVHSNERPYPCPRTGCDFAAARKGDLDRHLQTKKHRDQEDV